MELDESELAAAETHLSDPKQEQSPSAPPDHVANPAEHDIGATAPEAEPPKPVVKDMTPEDGQSHLERVRRERGIPDPGPKRDLNDRAHVGNLNDAAMRFVKELPTPQRERLIDALPTAQAHETAPADINPQSEEVQDRKTAPGPAQSGAAKSAPVAQQAKDDKKKPEADGARASIKNLPWIPVDVTRYARPEYINAHLVAKGLAEAFMVAYWRNQCRGLPTSCTSLAPILNSSWRSIKTHLDAIVSIQELTVEDNNGKPVFRCNWLDDAWKHAAEVSEGRRKGGLARQANAQQMQKG